MALFINCKEATYYSSLKEENKLNFVEKIKYKFHLKVCPPCQRFENQLKLLSTKLREMNSNLEKNPIYKLDSVKKEEIRLKIEEKIKK